MERYPSRQLDVAVLEETENFALLEEDWEDLYRHSPRATPFQSWAWLYSWWESYGEGYELRLITVWAGDLLVSILPMMLERGRGIRKLLFVGTGLTDYNDLLVRQGWEEPASEAGLRALQGMDGWHVIELQELRPTAATWDLLRVWRGPKISISQSVCPKIEVRPWDELLMSVSRNLRKKARQDLRKTEEDGVSLRPVGPNDIEQAARRCVELHREWWQGKDIAQEHTTRVFESHLLAAVRRMTDRGLGTIFEFVRDGEVIISVLWIFGKDFVGSYLYGASQEALTRYQVSSLATWNGINLALIRNSTHLDMLRGEEPYKLRWNPETSLNRRVILGRGRIHWEVYTKYRLLRVRIRMYEESEDTPQWIRTAVNRLRRI